MTEHFSAYADAREHFLELVEGVRPELHRYCARLAGSVVEGEDIVQDTLAKAIYALSLCEEVPVLRPWLFRLAHEAALDFLKRAGRSVTEGRTGGIAGAPDDEAPLPEAARAALAQFAVLPVLPRSALILGDVLGHSLEESAETLDASVASVKSALLRGRAAFRARAEPGHRPFAAVKPALFRYAALFNARDWAGVGALLAEDCSLDLVAKSQRRGKEARKYFDLYAKEDVTLRPGNLDGAAALGVYPGTSGAPAYFVVLTLEDDRVVAIRDFRYVPYIAAEASFTPSPTPK